MTSAPPDSARVEDATSDRESVEHVRADLRDAGVLFRTELRTRIRRVRGEIRQVLAVAFMALVFGIVLPLFALVPAIEYGRALAGETVPAGQTGAVLGIAGVLGAYLGVAAGFNQNRSGSLGPLVRTSISPRAVALGRLASETVQTAGIVVVPGIVVFAAVAAGAGRPVPPLALALALFPVFVASLLVGRVLGDGLRYLNYRVGFSLWTKALVLLVVTTAAYVGSQVLVQSRLSDGGDPTAVSVPPLVPGEPLQAYAVVALDPLSAASSPLGLLVAGVVLVTAPLCLTAALRAEAWLLAVESGAGYDSETGTRGVPRPFTAAPSLRVAWRYLLRTRRDPRMLAHLSPLLFGALGMLGTAVTDPGLLLVTGPGAAVVGGTALAGAAYCLNPLGDDSDQLPLLLTSARSVGVLLRGRVLAGAVPGLVVAIGVGAPLAIYQWGLSFAVGQSLLAVALAGCGAGTALGIGALVPKFERREYMNVERAHPSTVAVLGFLFAGVVVSVVGLLLVFWTLDTARVWLPGLAWVVYLAVLGVPGLAGYVYAVRKFDALTLDDV
jgi:ABC-2 type transport system permease protein